MNTGEEIPALSALDTHVQPEDLMLYTMELLSAAESHAIEDHLDSCEACRAELAEVRADLGFFALASVSMEKVPDASRARLLAAVAEEGAASGHQAWEGEQASMGVHAGPTPVSADVPDLSAAEEGSPEVAGGRRRNDNGEGRRAPQPRPASRLTPWLGWAVAAGLFLVAGHFHRQSRAMQQELVSKDQQIASLTVDTGRAREVLSALTDPAAQRVTLTLTKAPPPAEPTGRATYLPDRGTLIFIGSHLRPLPAGKTYELWLIPANGSAPRPAGTFRPDEHGNANVIAPQMIEHLVAKAFGVTIEGEGGATTPTLPILLAGS